MLDELINVIVHVQTFMSKSLCLYKWGALVSKYRKKENNEIKYLLTEIFQLGNN